MTYAMLYVDNASVIATFEGAREATDSLNEFVREHPDVRDDVALVALDSQGRGVGDYTHAGSRPGSCAGSVIVRGKLWDDNVADPDFEVAEVYLTWDGRELDVATVGEGDTQGRVLASVPIEGIVAAMARSSWL